MSTELLRLRAGRNVTTICLNFLVDIVCCDWTSSAGHVKVEDSNDVSYQPYFYVYWRNQPLTIICHTNHTLTVISFTIANKLAIDYCNKTKTFFSGSYNLSITILFIKYKLRNLSFFDANLHMALHTTTVLRCN